MPTKKKPSQKRKTSTQSTNRAPRQTAAQKEQIYTRNKEITGIIIIAVSVLVLLNFIFAPEQGADSDGSFGVVSLFLINALKFIAGKGAISIPLFMIGFGVLLILGREQQTGKSRFVGVLLVFASLLGFLQLNQPMEPFVDYLTTAAAGSGGGVIGALLVFAMLKTIGEVGQLSSSLLS